MIVGGLPLSDNLLYGKHIRTQIVLHAAPVYFTGVPWHPSSRPVYSARSLVKVNCTPVYCFYE